MKLVGYRHKRDTDCVILAPKLDSGKSVLRAWAKYIEWDFDDVLEEYEEIEADLEYEDSTK